MTNEDKIKFEVGDVSVIVQPLEQGDHVKPVIQIVEKPKPNEKKANQHVYERPIPESVGGGFGLSLEQVKGVNEHISWLRSKYYGDLKE